jgi:pimeloyl-ACP methyl ester carboxylesterase
VQGRRHSVTSADGPSIGLLTAGTGPGLLLVHGGMGRLERWEPLWGPLTGHWQVTAMDRRGRGSSGDAEPYELSREYDDVAAVAASLADRDGRPADVFAHSYGALCSLGAAARGAPVRRMALYEPPGPAAAPREWRARVSALVADGRPGPAMASFLTEIIGLTMTQVSELRDTPGAHDVLPIVSATMPREGGPWRQPTCRTWRPGSPRRSCSCSGRPARPGLRTSRARSAPPCPTPPWRCCRGPATRPSTPIPA